MKGNFGEIPTSPLPDSGGTCAHVRKTYRGVILTSNPPQHPWICPDCFEEGVEMMHTWERKARRPETYEEIIKRKQETVNG